MKGLGVKQRAWSGVMTQYCQGVSDGAQNVRRRGPCRVPHGRRVRGILRDDQPSRAENVTVNRATPWIRDRQLHAGNGLTRTRAHVRARSSKTTQLRVRGPGISGGPYFNLQEYGNTYSRIMHPTVGGVRGEGGEPRGRRWRGGVRSGSRAGGALFTLLQAGRPRRS